MTHRWAEDLCSAGVSVFADTLQKSRNLMEVVDEQIPKGTICSRSASFFTLITSRKFGCPPLMFQQSPLVISFGWWLTVRDHSSQNEFPPQGAWSGQLLPHAAVCNSQGVMYPPMYPANASFIRLPLNIWDDLSKAEALCMCHIWTDPKYKVVLFDTDRWDCVGIKG